MAFSKYVFQEQGIRECAEFGDFDSVKRRSHEHAEARNLHCGRSELRRFADSGI
jgi:hypothetical protein